nr:flagellin [uncultured Holophaga sp.]
MGSILNNISAIGASRQLGITGTGLQQTIERLTTGKRINRASDDAAGLAISNKLGADIRIASQAKRNANDGVSYLQVADGVLEEMTSLLTRASELSEQAKTGTISDSNRTNLDAEFQNILTAVDDIATNTKFNGQAVFGQSMTISVGDFGAGAGISFSTGSVSTSALSINGLDLTSAANATTALDDMKAAIDSVSTVRASLGASMQQLTSTSNSLGIEVENFTAAYSQIRDANIADEVVNLTKWQILNQSGTSALSKANTSQQQVLALLQ